jgi:Caspase domain
MLHKLLIILTGAGAGCLFGCSTVMAEGRLALVVGNGSYQQVPTLMNPGNDAKAISEMLKAAGFDVSLRIDLSQIDMRREIQAFSAKLAERGPDTVAFVFYAGHGLQMEGESYLVPVDARIDREADVAIEAVRLSDLTKALEAVPSRMRIVVVDACRNNPFSEQAKIPGRGLAIVDAPTDSIVAYSTAPGSEAEDGVGPDSPFTTALLAVITQPRMEIERLLKQVRLRVHTATDGRQTPWESSSLTGNFTFFGGDPGPTARDGRSAERNPGKQALEQVRSKPLNDAYALVIEEDSIELYQEFLKAYGQTPLAQRIRALLAQRLEMMVWYNAVTINTVASYETFLERYGLSTYAATAYHMLERARQRGITPISAAALAMGAASSPAAVPTNLASVCQPIQPRSKTPSQTSPSRTLNTPPVVTPTPPVIINRHAPPVTINRHAKPGKEPGERASTKSKTTRNTDPRGHSGQTRPVTHRPDDGSNIAGAWLGFGLGLATGGGIHHGGGSSGYHHH